MGDGPRCLCCGLDPKFCSKENAMSDWKSPSERIFEIYSEAMKSVKLSKYSNWHYMTDGERDQTKLVIEIASIKQYLDEQHAERKEAQRETD